MKFIRKSLLIIVAILVLVIGISYINHMIKLKKESEVFKPIGKMVNVNGHQMHVYAEGEGKTTLVFMAGGGTSSPTYDFKSLYNCLSNDYRVAVVEKAGYGYSEDFDGSRDIDVILEETRSALALSGEEGPYILVPHSMSGIEALYWVGKYPEEVLSIIGLDMAIPASYNLIKINMPLINLARFGGQIGITRFFPASYDNSASVKYGTLTEKEKKCAEAVFYRRTVTKSMVNEAKAIKDNANRVALNNDVDIPVLMFISNAEGVGISKEEWQNHLVQYSNNLPNGEYQILDCAHYVHDIEYEYIASTTKEFLDKTFK